MTVKRPAQEHLTGDVQMLADKGQQGRFRMTAYTGAVVRRWWGNAIFDLQTMSSPSKLAMLMEHSMWQVAGHADDIAISVAQGVQIAGDIYEDEEAGKLVRQRGKKGFPWKASIGVDVGRWQELGEGETVEVNGQTVEGPISIGRDCTLFETSFVVNPADRASTVSVMSQEGTMSKTAAKTLSAPKGGAPQAKPTAKPTTDPPKPKVDVRAELKAFLQAFPDDRRAWAADRFADGLSAVEAKAELADILLTERAKETVPKREQVIDELAGKTDAPGIGFNGDVRQKGQPSNDKLAAQQGLPHEDRAEALWKASAQLRSEFGNSQKAFLADLRREGWDAYAADEEMAFGAK